MQQNTRTHLSPVQPILLFHATSVVSVLFEPTGGALERERKSIPTPPNTSMTAILLRGPDDGAVAIANCPGFWFSERPETLACTAAAIAINTPIRHNAIPGDFWKYRSRIRTMHRIKKIDEMAVTARFAI